MYPFCIALMLLGEAKRETIPIEVYLNSNPNKEVAFYSWISGAESYTITNKNPAISVISYPKISAIYITGTVSLPIETKNSFTGWVKGSRIVRITIDADYIIIEVPPDIPIFMWGSY